MAQARSFNPYTENGGTILAIAGKDFSVIAGDTRQSEGYSIQTRYAPKVFRLYVPDPPPQTAILTLRIATGPIVQSWPSMVLLQTATCLSRRSNSVSRYTAQSFLSPKQDVKIPAFQWYRHAHAKDMPLRAIARLIQTMLYAKRFFPYYVYNILGGIEEDGSSLPSPSFQSYHPHVVC